MRSQLENNNTTMTAHPNGICVQSKVQNQHYHQSSPNLLVSGNFENENYRLSFTNPYNSVEEDLTILSPSMHSCYLGFIKSNESKDIGPFILNITSSHENKSIQILDLDIKIVDEGFYVANNQIQSKIIKTVENKLKAELSNEKLKHENKNVSETSFKNITDKLSFENIQFKITPLPFDNFFINSSYKKRDVGVNRESQTSNIVNCEPNLEKDIINVLKDQIQVLKDQNMLLRKEQENIERRGSSVQKKYVIRKRPDSIMKNTRENSTISTDTLINSTYSKSEMIKNNPNLTLIANENNSLQEMLQEYMLENEALREMNITLDERRLSHNSEMQSISRQNRELSLQIEELNKKVKEDYDNRKSAIEIIEQQNENKPNKSKVYPITYERPEQNNDKTSYLQQYDILKNKHQNETIKYAAIKNRVESNVTKSEENLSKTSYRKVSNESLLEELGRIDETIKEHIRKTRFNETLRNMGKKESPKKN